MFSLNCFGACFKKKLKESSITSHSEIEQRIPNISVYSDYPVKYIMEIRDASFTNADGDGFSKSVSKSFKDRESLFLIISSLSYTFLGEKINSTPLQIIKVGLGTAENELHFQIDMNKDVWIMNVPNQVNQPLLQLLEDQKIKNNTVIYLSLFRLEFSVDESDGALTLKLRKKERSGDYTRASYSFKASDSPVTLGRSKRSTIILKDDRISSHQFTINSSSTSNSWTISNISVSSKNPTWILLDGPSRLSNGMEIMYGKRRFVVRDDTSIQSL